MKIVSSLRIDRSGEKENVSAASSMKTDNICCFIEQIHGTVGLVSLIYGLKIKASSPQTFQSVFYVRIPGGGKVATVSTGNAFYADIEDYCFDSLAIEWKGGAALKQYIMKEERRSLFLSFCFALVFHNFDLAFSLSHIHITQCPHTYIT